MTKVRWLMAAAIWAALLSWTGWNWTRTSALADARAAIDRRDVNTAVQRALDYLRDHPGDIESSLIAARGLSLRIYPDLAEPLYQSAWSQRAPSREDLHLRAQGFVRGNQLERAVAAYREMLEGAPDDPLALQRLAAVLDGMGRRDEAAEVAVRLSESTNPAEAAAGCELLGMIEYRRNQPRAAVAAFENLLQLDPTLERLKLPLETVLVTFVESLITEGEAIRVRQILEPRVDELSPPIFLDLLGYAQQLDGEDEQAVRSWRRSIQRDSTRGTPWFFLGRQLVRQRRYDEALEALEESRRRVPHEYQVLTLLAGVNRMLDRGKDAGRFQAQADLIRRRMESGVGGMGTVEPSASDPDSVLLRSEPTPAAPSSAESSGGGP